MIEFQVAQAEDVEGMPACPVQDNGSLTLFDGAASIVESIISQSKTCMPYSCAFVVRP